MIWKLEQCSPKVMPCYEMVSKNSVSTGESCIGRYNKTGQGATKSRNEAYIGVRRNDEMRSDAEM